MAQSTTFVKCPVCSRSFVNWTINQHIEECLVRNDDIKSPSANKNIASSASKLSKSPELVQSRKNIKSSSSVTGNKLSKSPESVGKNGSCSLASLTSPPLKRAKMEKPQTTSVLKQSGHQMQTMPVSKQTIQREVNGPKTKREKFVPLAEKLRPRTLDEYVGQTKILGDKSMLKTLLEADEVPSMIFWGPPGCGKVGFIFIYASGEGRGSACSPWNITEGEGERGGGGKHYCNNWPSSDDNGAQN